MSVDGLILRRPRLDDEQVVRRAQAELAADHFGFLFWPELSWPDQLARFACEETGSELLDQRVQSSFFVAVVRDQIVGRVSIRHELNDHLLNAGGHIGYAVRPQFPRRGVVDLPTRIFGLDVLVDHMLGIEGKQRDSST